MPVEIPSNIQKYLEGKIIPIEERMPHRTAEVVCLQCLYRYQAVWPEATPMKDLECSNCERVGYIIGTGA